MTEAYIFEFNEPFVEAEFLGIGRFNNLGFLLEHVKQIFNVNLRLSHFTENHAHVEKRSRQLHEVGLQEDEVAWGQGATRYAIGSHKQVNSHACGENYGLAHI